MNWFANVAELKRYEIPEVNGWIELRQELSVGEDKKMFANAVKGQTPLENGEIRIEYDMAKLAFGRVLAYLVNWSDKAPITEDTVQGLKPEVYELIEKLVNAHASELGKQKAAQPGKKPKSVAAVTSTSAA